MRLRRSLDWIIRWMRVAMWWLRHKAATEGRGADVALVAVGGDALIKVAMDAVRPGGRVMLFASTQHGEAPFDPAAVCMDEKTLMGSYSASVAINDEVAKMVLDGYASGFDLTQLISHRFSLEDAVAAIDLASHPQADSMKIVIQPGLASRGCASSLRRSGA